MLHQLALTSLMYPEGLKMALLRRKRLVRFRDREPTFTVRWEREYLTLSGPSLGAAFQNGQLSELTAALRATRA